MPRVSFCMLRSMPRLMLSAWLAMALGCSSLPAVSPTLISQNSSQCVVLIHGLWRSGSAMSVIARHLEHYGYYVSVVDYPSTQKTIPELSAEYLEPAVADCKEQGAKTIHMVSHSMGGILVRQYLQTHTLPPGGKVVMLSPPNQGSKLSEFFYGNWFYEAIVGPAGVSLTKQGGGIISGLEPVSVPVGIIAAYRAWSLWPQSWLPQPNDGTVAVASMMLPEMTDFVLVNSGHAMMRHSDKTHAYIRQFIERGAFTALYDENEKRMALRLETDFSLAATANLSVMN
jgi:triacylglycerol lipase